MVLETSLPMETQNCIGSRSLTACNASCFSLTTLLLLQSLSRWNIREYISCCVAMFCWKWLFLSFSDQTIRYRIIVIVVFTHYWIAVKSSPMLDYKCWAWSWSRFLGSQPTSDISHKPSGRLPVLSTSPRLLSQAKRSPPWLVPNYTAWWLRHTGVNSLPKATTQWCPARTRTRDL